MTIDWEKVDGLLPVIVQDSTTLQVLMLGYMNQEALEKTQQTKQVTFYSRTKKRLWTKGESSGHFLHLKEAFLDCDNDTLLIHAIPQGETCHLGQISCFHKEPPIDMHILGKLLQIIDNRSKESPETSYTASLLQKGIKRMAQKVGEEGVEVAISAVSNDKEELKNEVSDLLYHLFVLLKGMDVPLEEVLKILAKRMEK